VQNFVVEFVVTILATVSPILTTVVLYLVWIALCGIVVAELLPCGNDVVHIAK
jgi:hypothetical protein